MTVGISCSHCGQRFDAAESSCPACGHLREPSPCSNHPDRMADGQCVICGTAVCEECDGGDSHHACQTHSDIPVFEGWAQIYLTSDDLDAQLIRENLKADGIDAEVLSQHDSSFRVEFGDLAPVRVLVPAFAFLDAQQVIAGHTGPQGEISFACESCGEAYEPGQTHCASCRAELPRTVA